MRRIIFWAFLLLLASGVLGATLFQGQIAGAAGQKAARRATPSPTAVVFTNGAGTSTGNTVKIDLANNTVTLGNTPRVRLDPEGNTVQLDSSTVVKTTAADNPAFQPVNSGLGATFHELCVERSNGNLRRTCGKGTRDRAGLVSARGRAVPLRAAKTAA